MEAISVVDVLCFVIPSQHEEVIRVTDLKMLGISICNNKSKILSHLASKHEENELDLMMASIHIVAQEEIVSDVWKSLGLEDAHNITELTMQIAADNDGPIDFQ